MNVFYCGTILFLRKYFARRILLREKGSISIVYTFFIVLLLTLLGLASLSVITRESHNTVNFTRATQAQYFAEAGTEYGIKRVFQGQTPPYSESVSTYGAAFNIALADQDSVLQLLSTGGVGEAEKGIEVLISIRPPIGDYAVYATGDVTNVTTLDEAGDPDPSLLVENAGSLPEIDNSGLIGMAVSQGYVETGPTFMPSHGYPNFNYYHNGSTPNVTYVQGNLKVNGGRTVYGIFIVEGNVTLNGSGRVEGVVYILNSSSQIHGGGSPLGSSVTGGIVANGDVDGTGNHITVYYNSEYMDRFDDFENRDDAWQIISWREL